ncbi:Transcription factor A, mitochondrial [Anthophora quadrimaculata]
MAGFGRFIFFLYSENMLYTRSCSLNFYQNMSKNALKSIKETVFPPRPKKPEACFLLYIRSVKSKFIEENPHIKYTDIIKRASKEWAELDPIEKQSYQMQYSKNYETYMQQLKEYNDSITSEQKQLWEEKLNEYKQSNKHANNKQKCKTFGKPKKPSGAFLLYLSLKKNERDLSIPFKSWMTSITETWNTLSDAEKEVYRKQAAKLMEQYTKDLEEWETKMIHLGHPDIVRLKTVKKYEHLKSE